MHFFLLHILLGKELCSVVLWQWHKAIEYKWHEKQRGYFADKGLSSQSYGSFSSHVWMWELDHKESWVPKNWCFWTRVLEKTLESPSSFIEPQQFCEDLQDLLELTPKKDVLFIIGDWNAKIGSQETPGVTGKFGLGIRNEAGQIG